MKTVNKNSLTLDMGSVKKNKKSIIKLTISCMLAVSLLTVYGCGHTKKTEEEETETEKSGTVREQTASDAIDSKDKDFLKKLTDDTFYVRTSDGLYYPVYSKGDNNFDGDEPGTTVYPDRQIYIRDDQEIPTLYSECALVYYSKNELLDYITWERYYDLGWTIGLYNIRSMVSGRQYLDLEDKDCIVTGSGLEDIYKLKTDEVMIESLGKEKIDKKLVSQGLIVSTEKGKNYELEVYDGSYYHKYPAIVDTHAFRAYELYASIEYEPLQNYFYEIKIPGYLVNGYYNINNRGMLRLVRGSGYDPEETDFNEQVLYPSVDADKDPESEFYVAPNIYSEYGPLNQYSSSVEGTLGFHVESETEVAEESSSPGGLPQEAKTSQFKLWFPEGKSCEVTVESRTRESSGDCVVTIAEKEHRLIPDRLNGTYSVVVKGTGEAGVLSITGLWNSYDIRLVNCEQYNGQDSSGAETAESEQKQSDGEQSEQSGEENSTAESSTTENSTEKPSEENTQESSGRMSGSSGERSEQERSDGERSEQEVQEEPEERPAGDLPITTG